MLTKTAQFIQTL